MKEITLQDILRVTKGELICGEKLETKCNKYCFDSRKLEEGDIYVGLQGDIINGGIYYEQALEKGAIGCIIQEIEIPKEKIEKYKNKFIIKVSDTLEALTQIAIYKRNLYNNLKVVAITGSVGKTSTKDIIASVISKKYKTLKTKANFNNHIGVPMTILSLKDEEVLVIEMGMNHKGEISKLTKIAKPNICVITNVGTSHIGNLGSRENILKAKLEILEGCEEKCIVINNDNDMLHEWYEKNRENNNLKIHTFGIKNESEFSAKEIKAVGNGSIFNVEGLTKENVQIHVPVGGEHFVYNAICAVSVGKLLNLSVDEIKHGIEKFELTQKRMEIIKKDNYTIINDAYNASYESMKASLGYLSQNYKNNRKIAILGDMLELGDFSQELHEKVGEEIVKNNIDILICAGKESKNIVKKAQERGMKENNIYYFNEEKQNEKIFNLLKNIIQKEDAILIKASNSMKFFKIAEMLNEKN